MRKWRDLAYDAFDTSFGYVLPLRRLASQRRLRFDIHRRLEGLADTPPDVQLAYTSELVHGKDAELSRTPGGFRIVTPAATSKINWVRAGNYGVPYLHWLSRCPPEVGRITCTLGDGDDPTEARFAPSTNRPDVTPLPDPYFFEERGFAHWRRLTERAEVAWHDRSDDFSWRGITTGRGTSDPVAALSRDELPTQRLALCLAMRGVPGSDVRLSASTHRRLKLAHLAQHGVGDAHIPQDYWVSRKFAFDVDGNTNTWSNLIIRMHFGCCVLKVASRYGYRQWYYDRLKPWEHYVPVSADLSDLMERIEWVRANDREASEIGRRGQAFARTLTWEAVEAEAVALITANWDRPQAD